MSASFDKLKEILEKQKKLSKEEMDKVIAESGEMTADEIAWLESEKHRLERETQETVTMEQYLEALKVLDTVPEGSDEFNKAEAIVNKYESGG
jgi:ribosomal protein S2